MPKIALEYFNEHKTITKFMKASEWMGSMNWNMYTDKVIEHYMSPRNTGSMIEPDGEGHFGEPECGDSLTIYIKVRILI